MSMLQRLASEAGRRAAVFGLKSGNAQNVASAAFGRSLNRGFASQTGSSGGGGWVSRLLMLTAVGGGGYLVYEANRQDRLGDVVNPMKWGDILGYSPVAYEVVAKTHKPVDYAKVREAIADAMDVEGYDDGSYGPLFVRLAWHASGTYDKETNTGGSDGATMRFEKEGHDAANAGLHVARDELEKIKKQFPGITYADLWTLAGAVAIEEMGGPHIPWRPGRRDLEVEETSPRVERLPDASQGAAHLRAIFYRMGFNDQEIVALSGAHALGRCHRDRSGYVNPWTRAPTTFSNAYFTELTNTKWRKKKWDGPEQYEDPSGDLMMLPTDMALIWDRKFKPVVSQYAKDEDKFFQDFAAAFSKLLELGVSFPEGSVAA